MGLPCAGKPISIDFYTFGGVAEMFVSYELIEQGDNFDVFCNESGNFRAETCIEPEQAPCNVNTTFSLSVSCDVLITNEFDNPAVVIPGDINGDGITNLQDVGPFTNLLSSGAYHPAADIDMDCDVDLVDLNLFVNLL